jgi:DNA-binding NtrC family response regulator
MATKLRKTGIGILGDVPWGSHFCLFYETKEDLLEMLVPYFSAGAEANEFCVWVIPPSLTDREARDVLVQAAPAFDRYLADGGIEIFSQRDIYFEGGAFDLQKTLSVWEQKRAQALARGYDGMRGAGNMAWLEAKDWVRLCKALNSAIANEAMILLCPCPLAACGAAEILDVARTHHFALVKRLGNWEVLESSELQHAKAEINRLTLERDHLREEVKEALSFGEIIGQSPALRTVLRHIELVAPSDASVLILGESGTGKELVASAIHEHSPRRHRPLVRVNCPSVPAELFESEFFGHVKGAFTGAVRDRVGRFQLADGGTLFLDEVSEIPAALQGKFLRVLQEGQFERVGEDTTQTVDARIIAATNRDLPREVDAGHFRQDLYYRLSVFPIELPPLRERKEDIPALATHFLRLACTRLNRPALSLRSRDLAMLEQYDWPGNVRELQNVVERAVILAEGDQLRLDIALSPPRLRSSPGGVMSTRTPESSPGKIVLPEAELKRRERENILAALEQTQWRVYGPRGAAARLGLKPSTLASRMKSLGLKRSAEPVNKNETAGP